jgi:sec-independent protein translocase protein TatA
MFGLGMGELLIILVIALVVFGAGKLPEIGSSLGKSIRSFKDAAEGIQSENNQSQKAKEVANDEAKAEEKGKN